MASQDRRGILTGLVGIWRDVEYMCGLCFVLLDCMNMSTRLQGKVGQDLSTVYSTARFRGEVGAVGQTRHDQQAGNYSVKSQVRMSLACLRTGIVGLFIEDHLRFVRANYLLLVILTQVGC